MRHELLLPDGTKETLLHVPRYDFNWQFGLHAGRAAACARRAWLLVTGAFDNSPANPDAAQRVRFQVTFARFHSGRLLQSLGTQDSSCSHWPKESYFPSSVSSGVMCFGLQSWDEMFIGFFDAADDPAPVRQAAAAKTPGH